MNTSVDFNVLGKIDICEQLSSGYLQHKLKCNEEIEKITIFAAINYVLNLRSF